MNSMLLTDGYKLHHHNHYPENLTMVFSNFTPRSNKHAPECTKELSGVLTSGVRFTFMSVIEHFDKNFFFTKKRNKLKKNSPWNLFELSRLRKKAIKPLKKILDKYTNSDYDVSHIEALWDLGHLPINVRALDEGTICPIGVPMLTIWNTEGKDFAWVPNFLETILSLKLWKIMTSATIALSYRKIIEGYNKETDPVNLGGTQWQCHDFSMRGMDHEEAAAISGVGHLFSFTGTDCLPALFAAEKYYGPTTYIGGGVPATEHSVMCAGSKESEKETFARLIRLHPSGVLSVVSDTWDLWKVLTVYLPELKEQIMARDGKLVIRPDSGDPVDIICGEGFDEEGEYLGQIGDDELEYYDKQSQSEWKGVIELLWDEFGGTINEQGYKVLDSHIGVIYGDSITPERMIAICERLKAKGFASTNVVFGIGLA